MIDRHSVARPHRLAARMLGFATLCAAGALAPSTAATSSSARVADPLLAGFETPPATARPRVWWHWMNGNITKEGIKLDLEWMHRVGIGGFQNFDAALGTPQVIDKRLVYMTPEWQDAFRYATTLADQLGLEEAIAGSPGWSESGGPWVTPAQAMKKVVWSETRIAGGQHFHGLLPAPPRSGGPFQNVPFVRGLGEDNYEPPSYYADTLVQAVRIPDAEIAAPRPTITASAGSLDGALLDDGDFAHAVSLPLSADGSPEWILFDFGQPTEVRGLSYSKFDHGPMEQFTGAPAGPELQASDDGVSFRTIASVPPGAGVAVTLSFAPVKARYFRAWFAVAAKAAGGLDIDFSTLGIAPPKPPTAIRIAELALHAGARLHRFQEKAGFVLNPDVSQLASPAVSSDLVVAKADVIDLSGHMQKDGTLDWTAPPGQWAVLRFGYSPTGFTNHPASPEGTGLEVDKLSAEHVRRYMTRYLDNYQSAVGALMGKRGLQYVINDSYEAGPANWTDDFIAEFTQRRGYDPRPWMATLTGRVVESAAASDRFLWDYRRTLADLIAAHHYDLISAMLKERGLGHYGESHESGRAFIGDGMEAKRSNDVPMSAMWTQLPGSNADQPGYNADIRESASVAHIYGQNLVAAESLTAASGAWAWSPETLKPTADKELAMGLNRFVIHTSVHQPLVGKGPGIGLGPFGQWFTRNETWAEPAKAWVSYLARSSWMLQQGRFVADVAYFYGEDTNLTALFGQAGPPVPAGYNFDYVNADALMHKLTVMQGDLVTDSGMRYRVLALDPHSTLMSLPVLRTLRDLVAAGATLVGPRPAATPSLADDEGEFHRLVDALWGQSDGVHGYGKGHVYRGGTLSAALEGLGVEPDFTYTKPVPDTELLAVHRRLAAGDLYFVSNRSAQARALSATFRVSGRAPELWHADTGMRERAGYRIEGARTTVPLRLEPWGSVFVVFRKPTKARQLTLPVATEKTLQSVGGPWSVSFDNGRGAPAGTRMDALHSWSESMDAGIRYYSGTATYTREVRVAVSDRVAGAKVWLDLGEVKNLAEVILNGHNLGVVWKPPFRVDMTRALRPGSNTLQVKVTNLWVNRLVGDRQPGVTDPVTFTVPRFYKADSPLLPSGLLGPVRIIRIQ